MHQVAAGFLFKCLGKLPTVRETSRGIHKFKTLLGLGAVFAHGVRQRFQGSVSGFSGLLLHLPKSRKEPKLGMKTAVRLLSSFHLRCTTKSLRDAPARHANGARLEPDGAWLEFLGARHQRHRTRSAPCSHDYQRLAGE